MIKELRSEFRVAAAKGLIAESLVPKAVVAVVLASAAEAFHRAYFGDKAWSEAVDNARRARTEGDKLAMEMAEGLITDVERAKKALHETHVTTDFPLALANIRDRVRRGAYNPVESNLLGLATRRTANDFKPLRGVRGDAFSRLVKRPETASLTYAKYGSTEDMYQVANYELGLEFTWESFVNDDLGEFLAASAALGNAGRRTRGLVIHEAIKAITRATPSGTNSEGTAAAGGPTPANLVWLYQRLAEQTNADGKPIARMLTDIAVPAKWTITARQALQSEYMVATGTRAPQRNGAFGLASLTVEPMMAEVLAASGDAGDWIGFDNTQPWLEFAALAGYEAGPRTFTKLPDVVESLDEGSFDTHGFALKVSDNIGAKVVDDKSVVLVAGA